VRPGVSSEFTKYRERGAYHWREASCHPIHGWPYTRSRIEWVARQCVGSRRVLEIGCGDAALLARVARPDVEVTGIDSDQPALVLARRLFADDGLRGEFHDDLGAIKGRRFDAVILAEVIEHLDDADAMLGQLVELLTDEGRLVLTTPIRTRERSLDPHHVHEFWPEELQVLIGKYFDDVRVTRMHPVWFVDLMCFGVGRLRPLAMLANILRLTTGIELIDKVGSPLDLFWTQGVVGARPKQARTRL
jgi:SAM-dependent methyltransferase